MSVLIGSAVDYAGVFVDGSQEAAYVAKVLATNPIAYWILGEHEGAVARCQIDPNQNGTHVAVALGNAGIGDGQVCPSYDGAAGYTNIHSAALVAAFDGAEGTALIWVKVSGAGVWTDGVQRFLFTLRADGNNMVYISRGAANGRLAYVYIAGGTTELVNLNGLAETGWMCIAITWSAGDDEVIAYYNGAQTGAAQTGLGAWAGSLAATTTVIGAFNTTPTNVMGGLEAHCMLWDSALVPATIANLATV